MTAPVVTTGVCIACRHDATRTDEPWNNQYQCAEGCRCTMQGCCVGRTAGEAR